LKTPGNINHRETYLHLAAKKGDLSLVKSLIASGMCVNQKDNAGWTPIHEASNRGFTDIIAELLKAGADVNCKSLDGILPIHDAVFGNHFEAVKFLLLHGASPNEPNNCGKNALDEAACDKMKELLKSYGAIESKEAPSIRVDGTALLSLLQNVEEKQDRLLLFELRNQADADLYIQDLSQIQNVLNSVLAKQKSERDDLAKKYRASSESFKQGTLRRQIAKLVGRQKSLLVMAQRQKELGQKLQNYKNARQKSSILSKQVPSILGSWEGCDTENGTTSNAAPCPVAVDFETSHVIESGFLDQDLSQYLNRPKGNGEPKYQNVVDPQHLESENNLRADNHTDKVAPTNLSQAVGQVPLPSESTICFPLQTHLEENDHISMTLERNSTPNATLRTHSFSSSATGSIDANNSIYQRSPENVCTNESLQQHSCRYDAFQMPPVLESTHKCLASHQKNIPNKRISLNDNSEPTGIFSHAASQSDISQSSSQSSNNLESGRQIHIKASRRKKNQLIELLELGKIKPGEDVLEFTLQDSTHKASLLGNGKIKTSNNLVYQNLLQWIKALLGNDISVSWKYVCNKVGYFNLLHFIFLAETSSHPGSSNACKRILQFNSIMLIKDDELLPCHIMDQYWNFYVHCEKFGF
uniref:RAMA domain-containing protein n=1 Tax=Salvator merianae TaxID=96440 RepID=A0A8D0BE48_SALMN